MLRAPASRPHRPVSLRSRGLLENNAHSAQRAAPTCFEAVCTCEHLRATSRVTTPTSAGVPRRQGGSRSRSHKRRIKRWRWSISSQHHLSIASHRFSPFPLSLVNACPGLRWALGTIRARGLPVLSEILLDAQMPADRQKSQLCRHRRSGRNPLAVVDAERMFALVCRSPGCVRSSGRLENVLFTDLQIRSPSDTVSVSSRLTGPAWVRRSG